MMAKLKMLIYKKIELINEMIAQARPRSVGLNETTPFPQIGEVNCSGTSLLIKRFLREIGNGMPLIRLKYGFIFFKKN